MVKRKRRMLLGKRAVSYCGIGELLFLRTVGERGLKLRREWGAVINS